MEERTFLLLILAPVIWAFDPYKVFPEETKVTEKVYAWSSPEKSMYMKGGEFSMGVNDPTSTTGEFPARKAEVKPFIIDKYPVTVEEFQLFKRDKFKYRTEPEHKGYSWVFFQRVSPHSIRDTRVEHYNDEPWWMAIHGASWDRPSGLTRDVDSRLRHPVNHVSFHDAVAYCVWKGMRLPTETEWEYAARGTLKGQRYPWGDSFQRNRMNVWQGLFPMENKASDGWIGTSPVDAFPAQNDFDMHDMVGNVWEWTSTPFTNKRRNITVDNRMYIVKGGSFIDSRDGKFNYEARNAARLGLQDDYSAENVGFRCARSILKLPKHLQIDPEKVPRIHKLSETAEYKAGEKDLPEGYRNVVQPEFADSFKTFVKGMKFKEYLKKGEEERTEL